MYKLKFSKGNEFLTKKGGFKVALCFFVVLLSEAIDSSKLY